MRNVVLATICFSFAVACASNTPSSETATNPPPAAASSDAIEPASPPTASDGTCGGLAGLACPKSQYCSFPADAMCGAADQTGHCTPVPEVCTEEFAPVCGCNDKTYPNACSAAREGISVLKKGECGTK